MSFELKTAKDLKDQVDKLQNEMQLREIPKIETKIDFETPNEIHFYADNTEQVYLGDNIFGPESDSDVDLGATGVRWKDAFVDSVTATGNVAAATITATGDITTEGDVIAKNYIVSSSVTHMTQSFLSGSTIFGDDESP